MDDNIQKKLRVFFEEKLHISSDEFDQLNLLENCTYLQLECGTVIAKEGDVSNSLILFVSGKIEVANNEVQVATLEAPDLCGMLSYYERNNRRNATLTAKGKTEILKVSYSYLDKIKSEDVALYQKISSFLAAETSVRLNSTNKRLVKNINEKKTAMNFFAATVFLCVCSVLIILFAQLVLHKDLISSSNSSTVVTCYILVLFSLVYGVMVYRSMFPLTFYGLSLSSWKKDIKISLIWTFWFLATVVFVKWALISFVSAYKSYSLFEIPAKEGTFVKVAGLIIIYSLFTIIQEFCARGIIQTVLMTFAETRYEKFRAFFLTTALFAASHLHFSNMMFAAAVVLPSIFWSFLYERLDRRIVGVCVSHSVMGVFGFTILGLFGAFTL
jgi:membrane protease YdiL (CAAX protease family)